MHQTLLDAFELHASHVRVYFELGRRKIGTYGSEMRPIGILVLIRHPFIHHGAKSITFWLYQRG